MEFTITVEPATPETLNPLWSVFLESEICDSPESIAFIGSSLEGFWDIISMIGEFLSEED